MTGLAEGVILGLRTSIYEPAIVGKRSQLERNKLTSYNIVSPKITVCVLPRDLGVHVPLATLSRRCSCKSGLPSGWDCRTWPEE